MSTVPGITHTYPSKRDTWLTVVLWIAVVGESVGATVVLVASSGSIRFPMAALMLAVAAFVLWILYSTSYTLAADRLLVRSGPFHWTIPLAAIEEVRPTSNPLSSPACSLDRLDIRHQGGHLMISPEDKAGFLRELAARAPGLAVEGQAVRRTQPDPGPLWAG